MRDYATTGFLTNARRTIAFTIPLDKPATAQDIYFSSMNIQVRHINGGFLIDGDVLNEDYTVVSVLRPFGIYVTITSPQPFDTLDNIPLSVYVIEAEAEFYSEPIPEPVIHEKTFEELMADLLEVWPQPEPEPDPEPEPEPEPSPEPEPEEEPEEPSEEEIEEEETDESESDTGSEQLHSNDEDSD